MNYSWSFECHKKKNNVNMRISMKKKRNLKLKEKRFEFLKIYDYCRKF